MLKTLTATAVVTALSLPATAQTVCGERTKFLKHLSSGYSEAPVAMGLVSNGSILEVLASKDGSWTIIVTQPDGTSCVVAAGEAWEDMPQLAMGPAA
jgi:hypothetical protein